MCHCCGKFHGAEARNQNALFLKDLCHFRESEKKLTYFFPCQWFTAYRSDDIATFWFTILILRIRNVREMSHFGRCCSLCEKQKHRFAIKSILWIAAWIDKSFKNKRIRSIIKNQQKNIWLNVVSTSLAHNNNGSPLRFFKTKNLSPSHAESSQNNNTAKPAEFISGFIFKSTFSAKPRARLINQQIFGKGRASRKENTWSATAAAVSLSSPRFICARSRSRRSGKKKNSPTPACYASSSLLSPVRFFFSFSLSRAKNSGWVLDILARSTLSRECTWKFSVKTRSK